MDRPASRTLPVESKTMGVTSASQMVVASSEAGHTMPSMSRTGSCPVRAETSAAADPVPARPVPWLRTAFQVSSDTTSEMWGRSDDSRALGVSSDRCVADLPESCTSPSAGGAPKPRWKVSVAVQRPRPVLVDRGEHVAAHCRSRSFDLLNQSQQPLVRAGRKVARHSTACGT